MKLSASVFCLVVIVVAACNTKKQPATNTSIETATEQATAPVPDTAADAAAIRNVITGFYNWYNKNYTKFQDYHLYEGIKKTDKPPYRINWKEADRYQQMLRNDVQWLGEEFIQRQRKFLQSCDSAFKVDKEDEIPYGFDYDWYTNSQEETAYLVNEVNKSLYWPVKWSGEYATVTIMGEYDNNGKKQAASFVTILMKKENNTWKIARIGNEE